MKASCVLELLLKVADKASQIAKIIRKEKPLVDLLIEEKSGLEKNSRFFQDFKTLADVLIQETVRHYISQQVCQLCLQLQLVKDFSYLVFINKYFIPWSGLVT